MPSTIQQVSITVPAEHTDAVRDSLVEDIGDLADSIQGRVAKMETLSRALVNSRHDSEPLRFEAESPGERDRLRTWAKRAQNDAAETLKDLELYDDPTWWRDRSRSLLAVSEQVLEAVGPAPVLLEDDEVVMVTLSREQRDAILRELEHEVSQAISKSPTTLDTLVAERQFIEDALELQADLKGERDSYPLTTWLRGGLELENTGWDGTRRSTRLRRLTQRIIDQAEEKDAKYGRDPAVLPPSIQRLPEGEERAVRTAEYRREAQEERVEMDQLRSACGTILEALTR